MNATAMRQPTAWQEVIDAAKRGEVMYYHAPLDVHPMRVQVLRVFKNGKLRLRPMTHDADAFTADSKHLDRFRFKIISTEVNG